MCDIHVIQRQVKTMNNSCAWNTYIMDVILFPESSLQVVFIDAIHRKRKSP